jgi:hypothetical protein
MVPFPLLTNLVRAKLHNSPLPQEENDLVVQALADMLLRCYQSSLVELRICAPPDSQDLSERPTGSLLARWQAQHDCELITNLRSQAVKLEGIDGVLFPFLDGQHDRAGLVEIMLQLAEQEAFEIRHDGKVITDPALMREVLGHWVQQSLEDLARKSLLIG